MASELDATQFLPSVVAARKAGIDLPAEEPFAAHKLAALLVHGRIMRRAGWSEQKLLSEAAAGQLLREPPAEPRLGAVYHVLGQVLSSTRLGATCLVHHITDELVELHEVFVPRVVDADPEMGRLHRALAALVLHETPPEQLRCADLQPRAVGGGYRASPTEKPRDFLGYELGDAVAQATGVVESMLSHGRVLSVDIRAYAWPLLWLRYGQLLPMPDVALVVGAHGQLHAIGGVLP